MLMEQEKTVEEQDVLWGSLDLLEELPLVFSVLEMQSARKKPQEYVETQSALKDAQAYMEMQNALQ